MTVDELLAAGLPRRMVDVVALMRSLEGALPPDDGISWFLRLYRPVTEEVDAVAVSDGMFGDPRAVRWLDVVFANRFFAALREWSRDQEAAPKAWAPVFEARSRKEIAPLQFAFAGMNAHINHDLPFALVETWAALSVEPDRRSAFYQDFVRVNGLLEAAEARVKADFARGTVGQLDRSFGDVDDVVTMWKVSRARDAAWANAETLWALRGVPEVRAEFVSALDRLVGFAGRGLLRPVPGSTGLDLT
jgi:Family of unknown function (DUF5995)